MLTSLLLASSVASAEPVGAASPDRFSVGMPAEVDLVGLAFGVHPELLYRPVQPDGAFHLRLAPGLMVGPELAFGPVGLGVREILFPRKRVRPHAGLGVQLQTFVPYGHVAKVRLDMTMELGLDVRVAERWRVGMNLSPELGLVGGFGFGMAARLGPTLSF
jgi:hypothetical protein